MTGWRAAQNQKYSLFQKGKSVIVSVHPALVRRASAVFTDVGRGAVDAWFTSDDGVDLSVRQNRVVLAPVAGVKLSRKRKRKRQRRSQPRTRLRGEHGISRKAIAQGMSDVLRCPVCSCAVCLVLIAHGTAGAARIRHSLRPLFGEGEEFQQDSGAMRRENAKLYPRRPGEGRDDARRRASGPPSQQLRNGQAPQLLSSASAASISPHFQSEVFTQIPQIPLR